MSDILHGVRNGNHPRECFHVLTSAQSALSFISPRCPDKAVFYEPFRQLLDHFWCLNVPYSFYEEVHADLWESHPAMRLPLQKCNSYVFKIILQHIFTPLLIILIFEEQSWVKVNRHILKWSVVKIFFCWSLPLSPNVRPCGLLLLNLKPDRWREFWIWILSTKLDNDIFYENFIWHRIIYHKLMQTRRQVSRINKSLTVWIFGL